jgi:DNA polymerase-1
MFRKYGIRSTNLEDTMVSMSILFPDFPRGLDFVTSLYTREPYYKDEGKKWKGFGGDETAFRVYNAKDSAVCIESFIRMKPELEKQKNTGAYEVQRSLIEPLMYMQARGMKINTEGLAIASKNAEIKIATLKEELNTIVGGELNPASPKQLATYFYQTKGYKPYIYKGSVTTNYIAMKRLARLGSKEAGLILQIRKISKLKSTYLDIAVSEDGRLRSAMNPAGTRSGRLSSSEDIFGMGGNVQNLPMAFRKYIVADDDYVIYSADISQGENRIVAHIAPEPVQIQAFADKKDMHRLTASLVFGIPFEEVSDDAGSSPLGNGEQSERYWGKKLNHSLNYGMGYRKFALDYELPEAEAKLLVERWHQVYPGIRQYQDWIRLQLSKNRTLTNPYGRSRLFLDRWGDDLFKAGYDYIPQSTIAYKINEQGMLYIWRTPCMKPVDLLNQVHDSLVFQLPLSLPTTQHAQILMDIIRSLETPIEWKGSDIRLPVDVKVGYNLFDKDMKGVKVHGQTVEELSKELEVVYADIKRDREKIPEPISDLSDIDESSEL